MAKCNVCGHDVSDEHKFCPNCGAPLNEQQEENEENQSSETTQTKKRFPIKTAIIVLVCILVIGGAAYFIVTKYFNKEAIEIRSFKKAAEKGDVEAQINLANCYYYGIGMKQDKKEAVKWWRKAAEQVIIDYKVTLDEYETLSKLLPNFNWEDMFAVPSPQKKKQEAEQTPSDTANTPAANGNGGGKKQISPTDSIWNVMLKQQSQ